MEPTDLNSAADDRRLTEVLQSSAAPISDDGFSDRVLAALPPPAPRGARAIPPIAILIGGVVGLTYARWQGATTGELRSVAREIASQFERSAPLFDNPWLWAAGVMVMASCYSALRLSGLTRAWFRW